MYQKLPYFQGSLCTVTAILWLQLTVPTCNAISHVKCSLPLHHYFPQQCAVFCNFFFLLRAIPDVAHVSVSKSDTAVLSYPPSRPIMQQKKKKLQEMLRKLVISYLSYSVDRLEIWHRSNWGKIFIRGEILQGNPNITDRLFVSFIFEKEKQTVLTYLRRWTMQSHSLLGGG